MCYGNYIEEVLGGFALLQLWLNMHCTESIPTYHEGTICLFI